jgi:mRNA-degrading endonuclease RelE of RelBE toxin-antitoxin system
MSPFAVVWLPGAMTAYRQLRASEPEAAVVIAQAIAGLADEPRPQASNALGKTAFRRLRLEEYRVLYEVTPDTVRIMHVGRALGA